MANPIITESFAARIFATAWNTLNPIVLEKFLSNNIIYYSQKTSKSIEGKEQLLRYLTNNMNKIRKAPLDYAVFAEMAETQGRRPCVLLAQGDRDKINNLILFQINNDKISKIELYSKDPHPASTRRTGEYPGSEIVDDEVREGLEEFEKNEEVETDFGEIKNKFNKEYQKILKIKKKSPILALILSFIFPGFSLFYISIYQGFIGIAILFLAIVIRFKIGICPLTSILTWLVWVGFVCWGYFGIIKWNKDHGFED